MNSIATPAPEKPDIRIKQTGPYSFQITARIETEALVQAALASLMDDLQNAPEKVGRNIE